MTSAWVGKIRRFAADNSAASSTEYAVMTFIAIAVIAAVSMIGETVAGWYEQVRTMFPD